MRHCVSALVAAALVSGCPGEEAPQPTLSEIKSQLKAELKAELRSELMRELAQSRYDEMPVPDEELMPDEPVQMDEPPATASAEKLPPPIAPRAAPRPAPQVDEEVAEEDDAAEDSTPTEPGAAPAAIDERPDGAEAAPAANGEAAADPTPSVSGLDLIQLVVAERVNRTERIPEGPSATFDSSLGKVFAFAVIKNPNDRTQVQFQWLREGKVVHSLPLKVGSSKRGWRTWASTRIGRRTTGRWEVRVLDDTGALLGKRAFVVQ